MSKNKARYTDEELESIVVENRKALEDWSLQVSKEIGPILSLNKDEADNAIHKMYNALEELLQLRNEVKQLRNYFYDEGVLEN
jgi:hypothetical protein